jgi:hypothetical protein
VEERPLETYASGLEHGRSRPWNVFRYIVAWDSGFLRQFDYDF